MFLQIRISRLIDWRTAAARPKHFIIQFAPVESNDLRTILDQRTSVRLYIIGDMYKQKIKSYYVVFTLKRTFIHNMIILVNKQSIIHDILERYLVLKHNAKKKCLKTIVYIYMTIILCQSVFFKRTSTINNYYIVSWF